jgi:cobalt/nickel transport system permease protein
MHMADALLSPAVGGTMWVVSAGAIAYSSARVRTELDDRKVPLMGVLGAFLFAAQMINFTIPATGSSGHLGGGLLLAILLGPYAAFLTISSVLVVQALFFADGGLLALGCNIFNMGVIPAFLVYPLVYTRIAGSAPGRKRLVAATMISAIIGLQVGPLCVVLETVFSGISALPFSTFALLMQPIHLAIGVVEGVVTAAIVTFVHTARPELILGVIEARPLGRRPFRAVLVSILAVALLTGGVLSGFASKNPDGLEWAIAKVTGAEELKGTEQGLHATMTALQKKTAFLPDYGFKKTENKGGRKTAETLGTSFSGVVGGVLTLTIVFLSGLLLRRRRWTA